MLKGIAEKVNKGGFFNKVKEETKLWRDEFRRQEDYERQYNASYYKGKAEQAEPGSKKELIYNLLYKRNYLYNARDRMDRQVKDKLGLKEMYKVRHEALNVYADNVRRGMELDKALTKAYYCALEGRGHDPKNVLL